MSTDLSDIERFDRERPKPPPLLYKYVNSDRLDVLQNAKIRFTPPLNTNDIFEVRQTYALVWGPKMHASFKQMSKDVDFEEPIERAFKELGLSGLADERKKALLAAVVGPDPQDALRGMFDLLLDRVPAMINEPTRIEELLERSASKQLLLSLSERPDSSPLWAHYADNSKGFVIAFDTSSQFFRRGDKGDRAAEAEKKKRAGQVWAEHQAVFDSIEAERLNPAPASVRNPPRIRRL